MADSKKGTQSTAIWPLRVLNRVAAQLPAARRLDNDTLTRAAIRKTGLADFGDPYYLEGLDRLIESANDDARLHFVGRKVVSALVIRFLVNRLLLAETRKRRPQVFEPPLPAPLVILGLPRSGTTFLHALLALDPQNRAVPAWQTMRPIAQGEPDRRRQTYYWENKAQFLLIPKLDRIHHSRVDSPEECVTLLGTTFSSPVFYTCAPVYGYYEWLNTQGRRAAYREYLSLLKIIQSENPSKRLALKSPAHTGAMDALLSVIPDAMVVQTHRHPVPVCNSTNSLIHEMHNLVTEQHDVSRMTSTNVETLVRWMEVCMNFRDANRKKIHDIFFDQLMADPVGAVKSIYACFKLEWTGEFETRLHAHVDGHSPGKHGKHVYSGSDFGLKDAETAERFERYIRRFQL